MVVKAVTNIADEAKILFGWMVLILGAAFLAGSIAFFFSEDEQVMGMDLSGDEDTFGWYFSDGISWPCPLYFRFRVSF